MKNCIHVKGAKENNLKNIDVIIPRDKLVVLTGLSGSGKSSLAFDTIYAEGQRRYMESLSSYARQFLGQMEKPDVDMIEGLSPAISIDQKTTSKNPRSTVGTVTEIYDHFRLLYANIGVPHCPKCGKEIKQQSVDQMVDAIMSYEPGTKIMVMAPVVRGRKGEYTKLLEDMKKSGYVRVRVDGQMYELTDEISLDKKKKHNIEVVVDRLIIKDGIQRRLTDSIEATLKMAEGLLLISVVDGPEVLFSQNYACPDCGISMPDLVPRMFSFNNPHGACPHCTGLGSFMKIDPDLIIPDKSKALTDNALAVNGFNFGNEDSYSRAIFEVLANMYGFSLDTPFGELSEEIQQKLLYGDEGMGFEGIVNICERRHRETMVSYMREYYEGFMSEIECPACHGKRLKPESLHPLGCSTVSFACT